VNYPICIIGSGLAGSECAWQLAKRGLSVALIEMRPLKTSPAHHTDKPAELVCSNSFRSNEINNAVGLLKEEMATLDSLTTRAAFHTKVPAGSALAVDREAFSDFVDKELKSFENIKRLNGVVVNIEKHDNDFILFLESGEKITCQNCVIATGPLTDEKLAEWILKQTNQEYLYFYDSIAPIVAKDSIDMNKAFRASRWDKGETDEGDYINCSLNDEQYKNFVTEIENAELIEVKDFDKAQFFEGCLPIEEMVRRGPETLCFGPLKPKGLDREAHAVVQLRQDNLHNSLYNMVGFQSRMKWGEQKRIFQMIPGLEKAEFVRFGSMHRNTYICSPVVLQTGMELKSLPGIHFAGQITGCEGYVESAAIGLYVGMKLAYKLQGKKLEDPAPETSLGALVRHVLQADPEDYQPMNVNFGLFPEIDRPLKKHEKKFFMVRRAVASLREWIYKYDI